MRWSLFMEFCLTIAILFVLAGDIFLPQPYRGESQQIKANINHFIVGLLPERLMFKVKIEEKDSI